MAKITLDSVASGYNLSLINSNFDKIEAELQNKVLYRNNPVGEPNTMEQDLDMNGKNVINTNEVRANDVLIDGVSIISLIETAAVAPIDPSLVMVRRRTYTAPVDGVNEITLTHPYEGDKEDLLVSRNGVVQDPSAFNLSSPTTLSLTSALFTGEVVEVIYFNTVVGLQGDKGEGVPTGGSAGQKLVKATSADYDTVWVTEQINTTTAVSKILAEYENVVVTAATQTLSLPASPSEGSRVTVYVENFTDTVVDRNGNTILGAASNYTITTAWSGTVFEYRAGTWRVRV